MIVKNGKYEKLTKYLLITYLAIQPLLEILLHLFSDSVSIAGVSLPTIVRYGLLAVLMGLTVVTTFSRRVTKAFVCYLGAVVAFIVLQWLNLKGFDLVVMDVSLQKNLVETAFFVARYAIPVILLYEIYVLHFSKEDFKNTLMIVAVGVSGSMLLANLLGSDSISYSFGEIIRPEGSVLSWVGNCFEAGWRLFTSKGWFYSGNQMSSLLALLFPAILWLALSQKKVRYYLVCALQLLAMLMLGTRVSVYSCFILGFGVLALWLLQKLFRKERFEKKNLISLACLLLAFLFVYFQSPFYMRAQSGQAGFENLEAPAIPPSATKPDVSEKEEDFAPEETEEEEPEENVVPDPSQAEKKEEKVEHIASKYWIPLDIISEQYRFEEHRDFWEHVVYDVEFSKRDNARDIKELILNDIFENKGDALDKLVGIGEVPIYPEKDFIAQYYYIGILGYVLFILPFLAVCLWAAVVCFVQLARRKMPGLLWVLLMSVVYIYGVSFLAGHTLEPLLVNTYIALLCGMMSRLVPARMPQKEEKEND